VTYLPKVIGLDSLLDLPQLGADLARVEDALRRSVRSDDEFLTQVAGHLIEAGGKRLRPALAVAVGHLATTPADGDVILGAAAVELVHLGSLYHDDVMDEAATRRGVESVNSRWGNLVAILAGDFLLARASELASELGVEVTALLASTIGSLCEGQVRELQHAFDTARTEEQYLAAISGKTASLIATSCRIGAIAAGLPRDQIDALTSYGDRIGMVFQIVDDILDVVATDEELGKPAGNDLVEGVYTLPVIRALADEDSEPLRSLLGAPLEPDQVDAVRAMIRSNGAVGAAIGVARRFTGESAAALVGLTAADEGREVLAALGTLGDHLIENIPAHG
jgi:heptaprenyl diphosphate synthase